MRRRRRRLPRRRPALDLQAAGAIPEELLEPLLILAERATKAEATVKMLTAKLDSLGAKEKKKEEEKIEVEVKGAPSVVEMSR